VLDTLGHASLQQRVLVDRENPPLDIRLAVELVASADI
jgi:hypothetical protein